MIRPNKSLILAVNVVSVAAAVTWDPTVTGSGGELDASITLSNSNLTATSTASGDRGDSATTGKTTGKWYFEFLTGSTWSGGDTCGGFLKALQSHANFGSEGTLGIGLFTGAALFNGGSLGNHGLSTTGPNTVIGCAVDLGSNLAWFTKDGSNWTYTGNPASGTNGKPGGWTVGDTVKPAFCHGGSGNIITGRFKSADFTLTPPSGFSPWS